MASYKSEAILGGLLQMQREFSRPVTRGKRQPYRTDDDEIEAEVVGAAVLFVKYLGARAGDLHLMGVAELVGWQVDELENQRKQRTDKTLGISTTTGPASRAHAITNSLDYSSEEIATTLTTLEGYEQEGRISGASSLGDGWIADAATFVKRLAVETADVFLIGRAEIVVLEEERRAREIREHFRQEDEERQRDAEEEKARKWNEYQWVAESMLGDRLKPKVSGPDVKRLLELAGLTVKAEKRWVLTEAGVTYADPERAKVGEPPGWPAWSKSVVLILQTTLDECVAQREGRGVPG